MPLLPHLPWRTDLKGTCRIRSSFLPHPWIFIFFFCIFHCVTVAAPTCPAFGFFTAQDYHKSFLYQSHSESWSKISSLVLFLKCVCVQLQVHSLVSNTQSQ